MGRLFLRYIEAESVHCCALCATHLAAHDQVVSRQFRGRHGDAWLFGDVINVNDGPPEKVREAAPPPLRRPPRGARPRASRALSPHGHADA